MNNEETRAASAPAATNKPRIYVASLSDYNAGKLLGRWIDADQDAAAIHAEIQAMLAESREYPAEEWAIHDYEGFGEWNPRECESIDMVATVATLIAKHGLVFGSVLNYFGDLEEANTAMDEQYRGDWEAVVDYVEHFIDSVYDQESKALPDLIRYQIDHDGITRDFECGGEVVTIKFDLKVKIFEPHK